MELLLSEEQRLLRDSAAAFVAAHGGPAAARANDAAALNRDQWQAAADQGWLGILVSPDRDGSGLGVTDLCLFLEEAGKGVLGAPIAAAALTHWALARCHADSELDGLLEAGIGGRKIVLPAMTAPEQGGVAAGADGGHLHGHLTGQPNASHADGHLVMASAADGPALYYVPRDAPGLSVTTQETVDGTSLDQLRFDHVQSAHRLRPLADNAPQALVQGLWDRQLLCASAELLGVAERAMEITTDYLKLREQFGKPIGSFQALQHKAVDGYVDVELTRSMLYQVCAAFDDGRESPALAAAVKSKASKTAVTITKLAIQLHGAIGYTEEHDIGLYFKRALTLAAAFGDDRAQRRRFGELTAANN